MNQIMSWICLISICFLVLQLMIFMCEDTLNVFNKVSFKNKRNNKKTVVPNVSYDYKEKIAK